MSGASWILERWRGSAAALHGRPLPRDGQRRISLLTPTGPAVTVGRALRRRVPATGPGLVVRNSGGGLVVLDQRSCWIDVFIGPHDPLWHDDVGAAFDWLGEVLVASARRMGLDARMVRGAFDPGPDDGVVCFASRGRGEVVVGDRKLIGISQRRTRAGARFQSVWYRAYDVSALRPMLPAAVVERAAQRGVGADELGGAGTADGLRTVVLDRLRLV